MKPDRHPLRKLPTLASLLGIVALLALASPAAAHHHGESGFDDGPAGTIASYDSGSGRLVIDLADGGSISGLVSRFTWIEVDGDDGCDDRHGRRLHDWCRRQQLHGFAHGDDNDDWRHDRGSAEDLVAGAMVDDALLVLKDGRAFFAKIELAG